MSVDMLDLLERNLVDEDQTPLLPDQMGRAVITTLHGGGGWVTPVVRVRPRGRRRLFVTSTGTFEAPPVPTVHPAVAAADELRGWLGLSIPDVMALAGLSEGTYHWWVRRPDAAIKPGKGGRLLRLHSTLGYLTAHIGVEELRRWIHRPQRWDLRVDPVQFVERVSADAVELLQQARPPRRRTATDWSEPLTLGPGELDRRLTAREGTKPLAPEEA